MENLKLPPTEKPTLPIEHLHGQLKELLGLAPEGWKAAWQTPKFTLLFPNLVFRLVSLESRDEYTQEERQRIFELGFKSFMELPWTTRGVATGAKKVKVNQETQLWDVSNPKDPVTRQSLITVEIGCFLLLGLSPNNKKDIIEAYDKLETYTKKNSFRSHITSELISTRSVFRQWVKENNLDKNNDFKWDSEVTNLVLQLLPQSRLPRAFLDLTGYPLTVIDTVVNYLLTREISTITNSLRSDINVFQVDLGARLTSGDSNDSNLLKELKEKQQQLINLIRPTK